MWNINKSFLEHIFVHWSVEIRWEQNWNWTDLNTDTGMASTPSVNIRYFRSWSPVTDGVWWNDSRTVRSRSSRPLRLQRSAVRVFSKTFQDYLKIISSLISNVTPDEQQPSGALNRVHSEPETSSDEDAFVQRRLLMQKHHKRPEDNLTHFYINPHQHSNCFTINVGLLVWFPGLCGIFF